MARTEGRFEVSALTVDDRKRAARTTPPLIVLALVYIGLAGSISRRVNFAVGSFFAGLLIAGVVALIGWQRMRNLPRVAGYLPWSIVVASWIVISGIATWQGSSLYAGLKVSVWFAFIIPGLAAVLAERANRHYLLLGWLGGVAFYVVGAGYRLARGRPVLDVLVKGGQQLLFGFNRNGVNILVLFIVPFLIAGVGNRAMRAARWPLLTLSVLWIVYSGGRTGLVGLVLVGLIYAVTQPTASRRLVFVLGGVITLVVVGMLVQSAGGQAIESTNRFVQAVSGQRDDADEARVLLAKKAWHVAAANPAFGVGSGNFKTVGDSAAEDASDAHVAFIVRTKDEHNTYLQILAEDGFPAAFAFFMTIASIFVGLWRRERNREVCAAIAALGGTLFSVAFHASLGTALYLPMAVAVGVALEGAGERAHARTRSLSL
jgi:O-antigen ligase